MLFAFLNESIWFLGGSAYAAVDLISQPSSLSYWSKYLLYTQQIGLSLYQLVDDKLPPFGPTISSVSKV
jgi:hypothetical protein